jgi:hypothetical protein
MLRNSLTPYQGLVLFQAPSRRQRMARRRAYVITVLATLALTSAAIGAVAEHASGAKAHAAYEYSPSE